MGIKKYLCLITGKHKFNDNEYIGWYCCRCNNEFIQDTVMHEVKAYKQLCKYKAKLNKKG